MHAQHEMVSGRPASGAFRVRPLLDSAAVLDDTVALRRRGRRDGYLFFRRLIDPQRILGLRRVVLDLCAARGWLAPEEPLMKGVGAKHVRLGAYDDPWVGLQQELFVRPEFVELQAFAGVVRVLERVFGEAVQTGMGSTCRIMSPHAPEHTTPPHQDRFYVKRSDELWTVWIPLGDTPIAAGGVAVLPGSHRNGLLPHIDRGGGRQCAQVSPRRVWATCDYLAGDALMFHCHTLHRACDNVSDRLRVSVDHRYAPASRTA